MWRLPWSWKSIRSSWLETSGSLEAQYRLAPLRIAFGLGSFPVVMKDALNLLGVDVGDPIRPLDHCTETNMGKTRRDIAEDGLETQDQAEQLESPSIRTHLV